MKGWALVALAAALVIAALLISMGTNEGCLPWQQPSARSSWSGETTECR